jgi:hypothetical protein
MTRQVVSAVFRLNTVSSTLNVELPGDDAGGGSFEPVRI